MLIDFNICNPRILLQAMSMISSLNLRNYIPVLPWYYFQNSFIPLHILPVITTTKLQSYCFIVALAARTLLVLNNLSDRTIQFPFFSMSVIVAISFASEIIIVRISFIQRTFITMHMSRFIIGFVLLTDFLFSIISQCHLILHKYEEFYAQRISLLQFLCHPGE